MQAQVEQDLDQLATLSGQEPGQLDAALSAPAAPPLPPAAVAVGDPAAMLRRRPDIRQAERQLAANNAQIGQAVAQCFPSVTLVGAVGFAGGDAGRLFNAGNLTCLGGPSLTWNILSFPRTAARVDEAKAGRDAAAAQYRATVLSALQDADTSLSRYGRQRENVARLESADAAARRAAALGRQRETEGTASAIDVLDVERQRLQTEQSLAQAQATLTDDYVSLQKALGLGWARRTAARPKPHPRPSTPNADGGSSADRGRGASPQGCNSGRAATQGGLQLRGCRRRPTEPPRPSTRLACGGAAGPRRPPRPRRRTPARRPPEAERAQGGGADRSPGSSPR